MIYVCQKCGGTGTRVQMQKDSKRDDGVRPLHRKEFCMQNQKPVESDNPNEVVVQEEFDSICTMEQFLDRIGMPQETMLPDADTPFFLEHSKFRTWVAPTKHGLKQVFYVAANLVRRKPIQLEVPLPAPAVINCKPIKPITERKNKDTYSSLIIPDTQIGFLKLDNKLIPFHDRIAMSIALQIAQKYKPDVIIHLGDILDLPDWSDKFFRSPEMLFTTEPAIWEASWWFGQFRQACPESKIYAIEGNHDYRLVRYIGNHVPQAWKLRGANTKYPALSIPNLLDFDKLQIEYIDDYPNGEVWLNENLRVSHGDKAKPKSLETTKAVLQDARCSEIFGHIHRCEMAYKTSWSHHGPVTYLAASPGTMARLEGPIPRYDARVNWQQGLGWVDYEEGNGMFNVQLMHIFNGAGLLGGTRYQGYDPTDKISKDIGIDLSW